jgi:hypothetical protein
MFAFSSQDTKKVALVKLVRGDAQHLSSNGDQGKIKKGMWLREGTIIKTSSKSFVRLNFIDKSSMNIGPKSELKIEKFSKKEAGVINVLTGKIRSQVTKDYLNMDKGKSKLFIKSRNAVMGVRGTDFLFSANKVTGSTTTVLFEGSIAFNKISKGDKLNNLEAIVSKGRMVKPGEVSVSMRSQKKPTVPAKMNSKQFEKLNKNSNFVVSEVKNVKKQKSVVPPGLSGDVVSGDSDNLKAEIKKLVKGSIKEDIAGDKKSQVPDEQSKGFVKGDDIKPADGVMVHVDTGMMIAPGVDSKFDKNSGEWVSSTNGGINSAGEYAPPSGFEVNDEGQMLKVDATTGKPKEIVVMEIRPVDKMPPLDSAPTVEYKAPDSQNSSKNKGPAPAGTMDETNQEFEKNFEEIMNEEEQIEKEISDNKAKEIGRLPGGDVADSAEDQEGYLAPPPRPSDCSTCNQPDSVFSPDGRIGGSSPPPRSGKTRVKIRVNKK